MSIKGFQGTSLLDFPGRIASLLFWGGCNLTCPFCHNAALVLEPDACPDLDPGELLSALSARKAFIDGVVVSGGEPTLDPNLPAFLTQIKALGLAVKLDSNGLAPQVVERLIRERLIDALAIDLKTSPARYPELHDGAVLADRLLATLRLCAGAPIAVEYRTTCVPGWVDEEVIVELGKLIAGAPLWVLQQYHPEHALCPSARTTVPYPAQRMLAFAELAGRYVQRVTTRGV